MLQWITTLEKITATSHYSGTNRFGSFAPIRLNVAAQWLVVGVSFLDISKVLKYSPFRSARLLLEFVPGNFTGTRDYLHPRLVALSPGELYRGLISIVICV
jgi:hypothetical protein